MVAASCNDLLVARETAHQVHDLYRGDYLPGATEIGLLVAGVMPCFEGDPAELTHTVARRESVETTDRRDDRLVDFASALVALAAIAGETAPCALEGADVGEGPAAGVDLAQ